MTYCLCACLRPFADFNGCGEQNTWAQELEGKDIGKVKSANLESQVEVKKNKWASELEGKEIGKVKDAQLESNVEIKKVSSRKHCCEWE